MAMWMQLSNCVQLYSVKPIKGTAKSFPVIFIFDISHAVDLKQEDVNRFSLMKYEDMNTRSIHSDIHTITRPYITLTLLQG